MSPPWMPLYIADYLRDTRRLSLAEHGAYLLLIMEYWTAGGLPDDDRQLARIVGTTPGQWMKIRPAMVGFFDDGWTHKRINTELARVAEISSKRRASAEQRHSKSNADADANAEQLDTHTRAGLPSPSPSPSPSPKKDKIAADAATTNGKGYAFEDGIIRLSAKDFSAWEQNYPRLDLRAELSSLARWATNEQGPENWFHAVKGALAKRNREAKERSEKPANGAGNPLFEGIT